MRSFSTFIRFSHYPKLRLSLLTVALMAIFHFPLSAPSSLIIFDAQADGRTQPIPTPEVPELLVPVLMTLAVSSFFAVRRRALAIR